MVLKRDSLTLFPVLTLDWMLLGSFVCCLLFVVVGIFRFSCALYQGGRGIKKECLEHCSCSKPLNNLVV